jgi:3,4-dihydroxy 2-butanone 4-phosphate synthase / GTP cyclohydrolase II
MIGNSTEDSGAGNHSSGVEAAVAAIRRGGMVIVTDDVGRENEGDLVMAADAVTPAAINFMVTHARGLVCVPMEGERLDQLGLRSMTPANSDPLKTNFTVSVDLDTPGTTGISSFDRAATARGLSSSDTGPDDLRTPGHIFPLRYSRGGVLTRRGHTEASVDLARLAGRAPAGVICELMATDGTMLRGEALLEFSALWSLPIVSIEEIASYRLATEPAWMEVLPDLPPHPVHKVAETSIPTRYGTWKAHGYLDDETGAEHLALVLGEPTSEKAPLVRVHSECFTGDVLGSLRCDCGMQLEHAFTTMRQHGSGVIVYIGGHEGRGIGLLNKMRAYALQDEGLDTVDANLELGLPVDSRQYGQAAAILHDLGLSAVRLLTNNPDKIAGLREGGIDVVAQVPSRTAPTEQNVAYLSTKVHRMGHGFDLDAGYDENLHEDATRFVVG